MKKLTYKQLVEWIEKYLVSLQQLTDGKYRMEYISNRVNGDTHAIVGLGIEDCIQQAMLE